MRSRLHAHFSQDELSTPGSMRASRGAVTAGDARTAAVGAEMLSVGGNAVDAAVAAVLAAFVTEPVLTGPFGGGMAMVAGPSVEDHTAWSFFAKTPGLGLSPLDGDAGRPEFIGAECSFGPTTQVFHIGRGSVAVPLMLPGLVALQGRHGLLPLATVTRPAMALAKEGVVLSLEVGCSLIGVLEPILRHTKAVEDLFAPRGPLLTAGDRFHSRELTALLERVAFGDASAGDGGLLDAFAHPRGYFTPMDLESAEAAVESPIRVNFFDAEVLLPPPPASGGVLVGFCLSLLEQLPSLPRDETGLAVTTLAAMATANRARADGLDEELFGDPAALTREFLSRGNVERWLPYLEEVRERGLPSSVPPAAPKAMGSTTHVSVIDGSGMACSITHSNGEGSGHVVPGCGAMANNFLGEEDLHPKGFHRMPAGSRLTTMMCPTVVTRDGRVELAMGTGGSNRIRSAIFQVLTRWLVQGVDVERAVKMPRFHLEGRTLYIERGGFSGGFSDETLDALASRVGDVVLFESPNVYFGGVHAALRDGRGAGDPRRGGAVATG